MQNVLNDLFEREVATAFMCVFRLLVSNEVYLQKLQLVKLFSAVLHAVVLDDLFGREAAGACLSS